MEHGVPLSQVRDLLGHASITTTERYDNQKPEALMAAAKRLDTGESFTVLSRSAPEQESEEGSGAEDADGNDLDPNDFDAGDPGGDRTHGPRIKSPLLYR